MNSNLERKDLSWIKASVRLTENAADRHADSRSILDMAESLRAPPSTYTETTRSPTAESFDRVKMGKPTWLDRDGIQIYAIRSATRIFALRLRGLLSSSSGDAMIGFLVSTFSSKPAFMPG